MQNKVIYREIAGDAMLIPVGETVKKYNGIFMLTPSAAVMYKSFAAGKNRDEIIADVLDAFEIDRETVEKDYDAFMEELKKMDIV